MMSRRDALIAGFLGLSALSLSPQLAHSHVAAPNRPAAAAIIEAQGPGWQGGYGWDEHRRHCWRMRERLRDIRDRAYYAPPWERDRLNFRASELRERLRQECWGRWRED
jgi:hypothetical protein